VYLHFIQPGKPIQNAFIESFNGKFLDECLNKHWFLTLQEGQLVIEAWRREYRREYKEERTHSTIVDMTPREFILHHQTEAHRAQTQLPWPWCNKRKKVTPCFRIRLRGLFMEM
jgi:putative transposase